MASLRDIRRRIKSVKNTRQITRAMQLVAASKMKRAQDSALAGRGYTLLLADILNSVLPHIGEIEHPLLQERPVRKRGILVVSTDKGLCGPLNGNLFREIGNIRDDAAFVSVGRKGRQYLGRTRRELLADFTVGDNVAFREVRPVVEFLIQAYEEGTIDTVEVLYSSFVNTLRQEPVLARMLPLDGLEDLTEKVRKIGKTGEEHPAPPKDPREMKFEPSPEAVLHELPALFVKQEIYQILLEAKASEHSARMVAMKAASDNASNLVDDLSLEYNKARQAAITQEILEISAAASADTV
ncbi:MAG: ATP synthase F1 subunit gamma [Opitutales bacterium]